MFMKKEYKKPVLEFTELTEAYGILKGDSGEAKIVKFKSNLTSNDDNVKSFLSTVTYNYKEMTSLSNGDRITIKAQYSKSSVANFLLQTTRGATGVLIEYEF